MKKENVILICKGVKFYALNDEDAFFEWIKKIECIESFDGVYNELYLYVTSNVISDANLNELLALFHRYKVNMKQLKQFLTKKNKDWFLQDERVFNKNKTSSSKGEK